MYWGSQAVKDDFEVSAGPELPQTERDTGKQFQAYDRPWRAQYQLWPQKDRQRRAAAATRTRDLDQALVIADTRVDKRAEALKAQQAKVAECKHHGHGKRLAQRQRALVLMEKALQDAQAQQATRTEQASALGRPRERADRDFRKQTIMTMRTLLLENALTAYMAGLLGHVNVKVSLDCLLKILFERSGARMETDFQVVYWVNTTGFSVTNQRLLTQVADGLCAMDLRHQGKPVCVRLRDMSP